MQTLRIDSNLTSQLGEKRLRSCVGTAHCPCVACMNNKATPH